MSESMDCSMDCSSSTSSASVVPLTLPIQVPSASHGHRHRRSAGQPFSPLTDQPMASSASSSSTTHHHHHHPSPHHFDDIIEELESNSGSSGASNADILDPIHYPTTEPVIIRGNGNMTLFGLSNTFSATFPSTLIGRVSREEFEATIGRINQLLRQHHSTNAKLLLLGCMCCCCSFGCSLLWPTLALSKRTRNALEKLLANENQKLYNKLSLNWKLSRERCHTNHAFMEYVLFIEFLPKLHLYQPD